MKVLALVEDCERRGSVRATRRLIEGLHLVAKLQGFLTARGDGPRPAAKTTVVTGLSPRIADLAARAEAALVPPTKTPARGTGHAHQERRTQGPQPAGREPPEPAGIPISAAAADQLGSAAASARPGMRGYPHSTTQRFMGVG